MTPEYTPDTIAMILRCLRVQTEGPGPICPVCVHQAGLVAYEGGANTITPAGRLVLALAAERDLWRLRSEWQEARAASYAAQLEYAELNPEMPHDEVSIEALNEADDTMMAAAEKRDAARAAYVAAGGVV